MLYSIQQNIHSIRRPGYRPPLAVPVFSVHRKCIICPKNTLNHPSHLAAMESIHYFASLSWWLSVIWNIHLQEIAFSGSSLFLLFLFGNTGLCVHPPNMWLTKYQLNCSRSVDSIKRLHLVSPVWMLPCFIRAWTVAINWVPPKTVKYVCTVHEEMSSRGTEWFSSLPSAKIFI